MPAGGDAGPEAPALRRASGLPAALAVHKKWAPPPTLTADHGLLHFVAPRGFRDPRTGKAPNARRATAGAPRRTGLPVRLHDPTASTYVLASIRAHLSACASKHRRGSHLTRRDKKGGTLTVAVSL